MKPDTPAGKPVKRSTSGSSGKKPRYDKDGLTNKWEKTSSGKRYKAPVQQDDKAGSNGKAWHGQTGKPDTANTPNKTGGAEQNKRNQHNAGHGLNEEKKRPPQSFRGAKPAASGKFAPKGRSASAYRRGIPLTKLNFSMLCGKLGFTLLDEQADQIVQYLTLLMRWNKAMNLVGAVNWETALSELLIDSFYLAPVMQELTQTYSDQMTGFHMYDVGAGAGLPGIPLRILWQAGEYTMVEAREKRALFLQNALAQLNLPRTNVLQGRAENTLPPCQNSVPGKEAGQKEGQGDGQDDAQATGMPRIFLSRAFMPWEEALEFFIPFSQPGDKAIFLLSAPPHSTLLWEHTLVKTYKVEQKSRSIHIFTRR